MFPHDIYGFERPLEEAVRENPKWASARIRGLEAENRCLKMCLDNWRKLAEAAEWRDECNALYSEMYQDWLCDDEASESQDWMESIFDISEAVENAYQAALKAAKE